MSAPTDDARVERISVVGSSGCGKTTFARALARRIAAPHLELDAVFHQPGWKPLDHETFQERVRGFTAGPRWVIDGNYVSHGVAHLIWARADTIVWLDLPRWLVMAQLVPRTLRRTLTGVELWNGNRERLRNLFDRRPEENVMLWAWTRHAPLRARYAGFSRDGTWAEHQVHRLRTRGEIGRFLVAVDVCKG